MAETLTAPRPKANAPKPDATATTNTTLGSCVDVPCVVKRKVTYFFDIGSKATLKLPYAYAINGKVDAAFAKTAKSHACATENGKKVVLMGLSIHAAQGDKIELYLCSDAHPDFRKEPVYAFTVGDAPAEIRITEKTGKHADAASLSFKETKEVKDDKSGTTRKTHHHTGTLTGDIWLKITHKYTEAEAKARIPAGTAAAIRDAVLKLYGGKHTGDLSVSVEQADKTTRTVTLSFAASENCSDNIKSFNLYSDGLPRVHPQAWVAVIESALEAQVGKVTISSGWRPMIGSILHRVGLGLDVNYLDKARLNRRELRSEKYSSAPDTENVSAEEKRLFDEKLTAEKAVVEADVALKKLERELAELNKAKKTAPGKVDPLREAALPKEIEAAKAEAKTKVAARQKATKAWNDERDKNEPASVKSFRTRLMKCDCVRSVFDPWFMDKNTKDDITPEPNVQLDSNETLHADHLHLTVRNEGLPLP
ncbi:hypothetical protein OPU71_18990 [Niveibacterium sp. 24ML]|uniref:hypothetical protein n=1 Tax=Niveibacterium sp. 24ML TaxID=2985512 RepID=UPI0022716C99|nr:hypothetical protein [Niveibacterium sp. 24ML]MCX9158215.1 hypothetical protein [Niveibacterium sp. 24ML]